LSHSILSCN